MGLRTYLAFVGIFLLLGLLSRYFEPGAIAWIRRETGLSSRQGWAVYAAALLWAFLPVLFGAEGGDGSQLWIGMALSGLGVFMATIGITSRDEYRLLSETPHRDPGDVQPQDGPVVTSGVPDVPDPEEATTPFTGEPSVHTDWMVDRQNRRTGIHEEWGTVATGVESIPFALGDADVVVDSGSHRTFSRVERETTVDAHESVPEPAAGFMQAHPDLPDPEERDRRLRFRETVVPADAPVTVVGVPEQTERPGTVRIATAPPDDLLGTHAGGGDDSGGAEPVLVQGRADRAERHLRRRVYGYGLGGVALALVGQLLGFALSGATLAVPAP